MFRLSAYLNFEKDVDTVDEAIDVYVDYCWDRDYDDWLDDFYVEASDEDIDKYESLTNMKEIEAFMEEWIDDRIQLDLEELRWDLMHTNLDPFDCYGSNTYRGLEITYYGEEE